jgi:phosphoglucomutase
MADLVDQVQSIKTLAWVDAPRSGKLHLLDDAPHQAYIDICCKQSLVPRPRHDELRVVFTPLHGVGSMTAMEVLARQGFRVIPVEEQMTPDGQFPNVTKSPNPEVPESMDRAADLAARTEADLVLATDPDADRLGGLMPVDAAKKEWRIITGNEIAALLTHFKLEKLAEQGRLPSSPIVVRTEVTTGMITRIGRQFGAQVVDNLMVGFKFIAEVLWQLEQEGRYEDVTGTPQDFVIATEESHGALLMPQIRDKDAGAACLVLAELALDQKRRGRGVLAYLQAMQRQFGYYRNDVRNLVMTGIEGRVQMARMLDALRRNPPAEIGGVAVTGVEDLRDENGRLGPLKGASDALARNFLIFHLGEDAKIALRPSGTEPKAKAYVEVCSPPCRAGTPAAAWERTCREVDAKAQRLTDAFVEMALKLAK